MRVVALVYLLAGLAAGQALGTVAAHREAMQARPGYGVLSETGPRGAVIRRYVTPAGVVFGIAWQGPAVPDLQTLLGAQRFTAFRQAMAQRPNRLRRGPFAIEVDGLVVESAGHMRDFHGRAYLTTAIPAGLTAAVVR